MRRRHFIKIAFIAGGLALLGFAGFYQSRPAENLPDIIRDYRGPDDPAALQMTIVAASQDRYQMVMFHAPWCPYCRKLTDQFQAAGARTNTAFGVLKIDIEHYPALHNAYSQAQGVPETHIFLNGQIIDHFSGSAPTLRGLIHYIDRLQPPQPPPLTKPYISAPSAIPTLQ